MPAIVIQRLREAADPGFVFLEQLNVTPSHGRIDSVPAGIRRNEEVLDHGVRTEQVETIQKQLRIRRNALTDRLRQFKLLRDVAAVHGLFISLEQGRETFDQQGEIERIGPAGTQNETAV